MQAQHNSPDGACIGQTVRFTASQLGLMRKVDQTYFEPEVVREGDIGVYEGAHPTLDEWHVVRVGEDDDALYCPCHRSQFEFVR